MPIKFFYHIFLFEHFLTVRIHLHQMAITVTHSPVLSLNQSSKKISDNFLFLLVSLKLLIVLPKTLNWVFLNHSDFPNLHLNFLNLLFEFACSNLGNWIKRGALLQFHVLLHKLFMSGTMLWIRMQLDKVFDPIVDCHWEKWESKYDFCMQMKKFAK